METVRNSSGWYVFGADVPVEACAGRLTRNFCVFTPLQLSLYGFRRKNHLFHIYEDTSGYFRRGELAGLSILRSVVTCYEQ